MGLGGILDSGGDWTLEIEGGRDEAVPGGSLRGTASFVASRRLEARGVAASLVAHEEYAYEVTDRSARGGSRVDRRWESSDAWRQELSLSVPTVLEAGSHHSFPFEFDLPPDALPSFHSGVLRLEWRLSISMDVGGRDPSVQRDIVVPLKTETISGVDPAALEQRVEGARDGDAFTISIEPRPLAPGAAFQGAIETAQELAPGKTRVEVKLVVSTDYSSGGFNVGIHLGGGVRVESLARRAVHEQRAIWTGTLTGSEPAEGTRRYAFAGRLPDEPVATIVLPHGSARAMVDVVVDRRLRPDVHYTRPVAIGAAWSELAQLIRNEVR